MYPEKGTLMDEVAGGLKPSLEKRSLSVGEKDFIEI